MGQARITPITYIVSNVQSRHARGGDFTRRKWVTVRSMSFKVNADVDRSFWTTVVSHETQFIQRPIAGGRILQILIAIHPAVNKTIILNYNGAGGSLDGYCEKYLKIADLLQRRNIGAVVRVENRLRTDLPYAETLAGNFGFAVDYVLKHARGICGQDKPDLFLMGFSAGASAVAVIAKDFPQVRRILMVAPSADAGREALEEALTSFAGEVYMVFPDSDEVISRDFSRHIYLKAADANPRKVFYRVVPHCGHSFRGERNGRILSKAPLWAFAGDKSFPSPEGGVKLYD